MPQATTIAHLKLQDEWHVVAPEIKGHGLALKYCINWVISPGAQDASNHDGQRIALVLGHSVGSWRGDDHPLALRSGAAPIPSRCRRRHG